MAIVFPMIGRRVTAEEVLESDWPYEYAVGSNGEESYDGGCACCLIHGVDFTVSVHCWRTCNVCVYSGIHVCGEASEDVQRRVAEHIRDNNGWSDATDWEIRLNDAEVLNDSEAE